MLASPSRTHLEDVLWTAKLKGTPMPWYVYFISMARKAPVSGLYVMARSYHRVVEAVQLPVLTLAFFQEKQRRLEQKQ